jgi:hypothetical protein
MASITLKDIPMELHAQLKNEAAANFRSLTQEAMSRLERSSQLDAALTTKRDQQWIDEALASGPITPLSKREMKAIRNRVLTGKKCGPPHRLYGLRSRAQGGAKGIHLTMWESSVQQE